MFSFSEMEIECPSCKEQILIPDDEVSDVFECPFCLQTIEFVQEEEEEVVLPLEPPPVLQKAESRQLNQQKKNKGLKIWAVATAGLSFLSLFIPIAGFLLAPLFWISSFILCLICLGLGEHRTGVSTMLFLIIVMPLLVFFVMLLADRY